MTLLAILKFVIAFSLAIPLNAFLILLTSSGYSLLIDLRARQKVERVLRGTSQGTQLSAPKMAERALLILCSREQADGVLGDLHELHARIATRHGQRYANLWYWSQFARSAGPLLWAALWRLVAIKELLKRLVG